MPVHKALGECARYVAILNKDALHAIVQSKVFCSFGLKRVYPDVALVIDNEVIEVGE